MAKVMKKKPEPVSVQITMENPKLWAAGRNRIVAMEDCGVRTRIDVTEGTNSTVEKEGMAVATTAVLDEVLGINPEASDIVINEIPGVSRGKGGIMLASQTKADRKAARKVG